LVISLFTATTCSIQNDYIQNTTW